MLTEDGMNLKNPNAFEKFGRKWFPHQLFPAWACNIQGEILYNGKKVLKPKMTDLGLAFYVCLDGDWQLYLVQNFVCEVFDKVKEHSYVVRHTDGDMTNNNINNLELVL